MTVKEPLRDLELNTYELSVPMDLSVFDSYEGVELTLVETVAKSIVAEADEFEEDDISYITTQVSFDAEALESAYHSADVGIASVETRTELASVDDDE